MRPIIIDQVACSVCRSLCHTSKPCKTAELIEMPFGLKTLVGPGNCVSDGVQIPHGKGRFWGKERHCKLAYRDYCRELCNKSSAVLEMGDRGHNRLGPKRGGDCGTLSQGNWVNV